MIGLTALWLLFCGILLALLLGIAWLVNLAGRRIARWVWCRWQTRVITRTVPMPVQAAELRARFQKAMIADRDPLLTRHRDGRITLTERPRGGRPVVVAEMLPPRASWRSR